MGNFSRDPQVRLDDAISKQYVGVRMQQGVPLLDADWNELEDLRRVEFENLGRLVIGDGVPLGSNGFQIVPLANGGVNTVVLTANMPGGTGVSTIQVILDDSTASSALGFDLNNRQTTRTGSSPAILTGNVAEPFALEDGQTLSVKVDELPAETIAFAAGDFVDLTAATAAEIVAVINAAVASFAGSVGGGNDFLIRGPGRLLVDGRMTVIENELMFSQQPLYLNNALAAGWSVDPISAISTPGSNQGLTAYLDVWSREVDSQEDHSIKDERVGIETSVRLRREWAVRVVAEAQYNTAFQNRPANHSWYRLALIQRAAANDAITSDMITDLRETDVAIRREIAFYGSQSSVLVDTVDFTEMLATLRNNVRDFIVHLTTRFIDPETYYTAAEMVGIDSMSAIANVADQGLALLAARSMSTQDAIRFFRQLQTAEERFVSVWTETVLPLNKSGVGLIYERAYAGMVSRIDQYLTGPAPGEYSTIPGALDRGDLNAAVRAQNRINLELGRELDRATGTLLVSYLGSTSPTVERNATIDMRYELTGSVTPADDIGVEVFIDDQWITQLRNGDGTVPYEVNMGPGEDDAEFIVSVTVPNVPAASTGLSLQVYAVSNRAGLWRDSTQKTLTIGQPTPSSEEDFAIGVISSNLTFEDGEYRFPSDVTVASFNFRFTNNTNSTINVDIAYLPEVPPAGWQIFAPALDDLQNVTIASRGNVHFGFDFMRPGANGSTLDFGLNVTGADTAEPVGEATVCMRAVANG
jgi:hypothetical protein